jgi:hypothetical protein
MTNYHLARQHQEKLLTILFQFPLQQLIEVVSTSGGNACVTTERRSLLR